MIGWGEVSLIDFPGLLVVLFCLSLLLVVVVLLLLLLSCYHGDGSVSYTATLFPQTETVNHKPVIHRIQNDTITRGSNFTVNCTAVSSAHNHVQWYKGCYDDCTNKTTIDNVVMMKVFYEMN